MPENFGESSEVKSYLSDESVTQKAGNAVNGKKFTRLWNGDMILSEICIKEAQSVS